MFAWFTLHKINSAASRLSSWVSNSNTSGKSSDKGNKRRPFKTRPLGKSALSKLPRNKRALLIVLLLASSAAAFTSFGIRRAMQSGNAAAFVSQSVPATMIAGETYMVTVRMLNQGTTTWTPGQAYRLGSQNPHDNTIWMTTTNRVNLVAGASVSPGATATFSFEVTAPSSPGSYNFQWRMVQDGVEWFGATTPNIAVQVVPPPGLTKLKEYVYAGGRLITSEEKSCVPTLNSTSAPLPQGGGTGSFNVSIPPGCDWTAIPSAGWITITGGSSGSGSGTVNYSVAANSGAQRTGTITINGQAFNITQAPNPASCAYSLSKTSESLSEQAGSGSVALNTGAGCPWNASSNAGWLTITSPTSGDGLATINYSVTANNSGAQRVGVITVGGQTLTITQAPNQASCTFALSPGSQLVGVGGGSGSFNVTTGAGCQWDAANPNGWITITGGATGISDGPAGTAETVSFTVHANNGASRAGTILVRGQAFTVTQCGYVISPEGAGFDMLGGDGSITVSAAAGCSWSATSNDSWIGVTAGSGGSGNGVLNYHVQHYWDQGGERSGSITVAGRTFWISQVGPPADCPPDVKTCLVAPSQPVALNQSAPDAELRGVTARYFNNKTLSGQPSLQRIDPIVNFKWTGKRTGNVLPADGFSVRWDGQLSAPSSEAYTFYLYSDGGARLWVNNQLVIDRWQPPFEQQTSSAPIELKADAKADIRLEYFNSGGDAVIRLLWSSASTPRQIIPQRYLYPESTTNKSAPADIDKQTGMLAPPGFGAGPKALISELATPLLRVVLALSIAACMLALFLWNVRPMAPRRRGGRGDSAGEEVRGWRLLSRSLRFLGSLCASAVRRTHRGAGQVARLIVLLIAPPLKLLLEGLRTATRKSLSLWRSSGVARLKPVLRRAFVIALIVRLAAPLSPAEAQGLALAAQTAWRKVSAYTSAAVKRSAKTVSGARPVKVVSMTPQTQPQVDTLHVCPSQLIMFVGERYTLTPVALNVNQQVVHGAGMSWSSLNSQVAEVSSFGQVEAIGVGNTTVEVQSGGVSKQIPIEVRAGMRPTGSNQEADLDIGNCSEEQASMYAPKSAAAALPQQNLIPPDENGVLLDWDPLPVANSRATSFRNAVGNPRFTPVSQGGGAVPTSAQLGSYNYQFNVPVVSVGGRGASANIGMTFNSRVWNVDDGKMTFNYVGAYPGPGWSMGYGKIIRNYNATATGDHSGVGSSNSPGDYLLVTGDGTRIRLAAKYESDRWLHESDDGSFLQFNPRNGELRYPDGSRMVYSPVNGCLLPTAMINSNGGTITMSYRDYCEGNCVRVFRHRTALSHVRDTLGRYVTFHYYGDNDYPAAAPERPAGELAAIKAPDENGVQQEVIKVEYQSLTLTYNFGSLLVNAPASGSTIQVVRRIYYPQTGRGFLFENYSGYGMPCKISSRMRMNGAGGITDGEEIAYTTYDYNQEGILNDFPQFTHRAEWWRDKTDHNGNPTTAPTTYIYSRTTDAATEVATVIHEGKNVKEVTTTGTDSSQQLSFGKVISVELKRSQPEAVRSKQVFTYMLGPAGEVEIQKVETFDDAGQGTLVSFEYGPYGRVINKYEYGYKQGSDYQVRRRTQYEYVDEQNYLDARFLRLVSRVSIFDGSGAEMARTRVEYDNYAAMGDMENYGLSASVYPPNHDATYNQSYVLRGNPTSVTTFSKLSPNEESMTRRMRYDIFGNVVKAQLSCCVEKSFGFSHVTYYSQPDWVRSGPDSATELNLKTDYEYNNFTGQVREETNPDGLLTRYEYDRALRLIKVISPTGVEERTEFQDSNGNDLLVYKSQTIYDDQGTEKIITSKQWFDGAGRVIRAGTGTGEAPNSYDMTATVYDGWGRVTKRSNPYLGDADGNPQGGNQFWTETSYDELSRVVDVILPQG